MLQNTLFKPIAVCLVWPGITVNSGYVMNYLFVQQK